MTATWSSSAPSVATVSATGLLQALAGGTVTVTALCVAALIGQVAVACFDTLMDAPQIVTLVALIAAGCGQRSAIIGLRRISLHRLPT